VALPFAAVRSGATDGVPPRGLAARYARPMRGKDGVAIFCDRDAKAGRAAIDDTLAEIGHVPSDAPTDVTATAFTAKAGVCVRLDLTKAAGIVLARRVARRLARPVRLFTATLVDEDPIECAVDELVLGLEGAPRQGTWGRDFQDEIGGDWSSICDGKSYFAVSCCLEAAARSVLGDAFEQRTFHLTEPVSLGSARLDEIARQVRLADEAKLADLGGRACVRVRNAGATVTSFLSESELASLRAALCPILG
jgi:hypothetical protein